jgi:hypothetical protein
MYSVTGEGIGMPRAVYVGDVPLGDLHPRLESIPATPKTERYRWTEVASAMHASLIHLVAASICDSSMMVLTSPPSKSFGFSQTVSKSLRQTTWLMLDHPRVPRFKSERWFSIIGILRGDDSRVICLTSPQIVGLECFCG